jgi:hypothetical protein
MIRTERIRNGVVDKAAKRLRAEYPDVEIHVSWAAPHWQVALKSKSFGSCMLTCFHWAGEDNAESHIRAGVELLAERVASGVSP